MELSSILASRTESTHIKFQPINNRRLAELCGPFNEHLSHLEQHFDVTIRHKSAHFQIIGVEKQLSAAKAALVRLYQKTASKALLSIEKVFLVIKQIETDRDQNSQQQRIDTRYKSIQMRNKHQLNYVNNITNYDLSFAIGPAGTGKTYLAVASAVQAFEKGHVQRLIFVRPAVEAGEKLGFLPGDLVDKVLPYLRPIYDALYEMLGFGEVQKLLQKDVIEIVPLAFMRGRTLNDAFIILDEAQNTTVAQMKMFLTRIGFGSKTVVTGDITQTDLPQGATSGLSHAIKLIKDLDNVSLNRFNVKDVVRHPLVASIIQAYDESE